VTRYRLSSRLRRSLGLFLHRLRATIKATIEYTFTSSTLLSPVLYVPFLPDILGEDHVMAGSAELTGPPFPRPEGGRVHGMGTIPDEHFEFNMASEIAMGLAIPKPPFLSVYKTIIAGIPHGFSVQIHCHGFPS
jgi:hypothetical protein